MQPLEPLRLFEDDSAGVEPDEGPARPERSSRPCSAPWRSGRPVSAQ
jgi:hypothetical protein